MKTVRQREVGHIGHKMAAAGHGIEVILNIKHFYWNNSMTHKEYKFTTASHLHAWARLELNCHSFVKEATISTNWATEITDVDIKRSDRGVRETIWAQRAFQKQFSPTKSCIYFTVQTIPAEIHPFLRYKTVADEVLLQSVKNICVCVCVFLYTYAI